MNFSVKGNIDLYVQNEKGEVLQEFHDHNLVMDRALAQIAQGIMTGSMNFPTKVSFGSNAAEPTVDDNEVETPWTQPMPIIPEDWSGKGNAEGVMPDDGIDADARLRGISATDPATVEYFITMGTGENNGATLNEMALLFEDETIFSRRVIPRIRKEVGVIIKGIWSITVRRADNADDAPINNPTDPD